MQWQTQCRTQQIETMDTILVRWTVHSCSCQLAMMDLQSRFFAVIIGFMKLTICITWSWRAKFYWRHKHLDSFIQAGGLAEQVLGSKLEVCKCCNTFLNMDSDHRLLTCPQIVEFPEMSHGWLPRGDMSKPEVSRDVKKTMENLFAFFGKNLWLKMFFFVQQ